MRIPIPNLIPMADRGPLRVLFLLTSMPVGGAETLLANLVRRMDREHFVPEIGCLKEPGPLGDLLADELPVHARLLSNKWDARVLVRLCRLMRSRRIDALVTVGAGDKMFWGRLAAWWSGVPVICSAIHSTGWPDSIGFLNRRLTCITDAFIAVAATHARFLVSQEKFPAEKVHVIPNGIDTDRFRPSADDRCAIRQACGIPKACPVIGIVAALRPEKNHELFLRAAALTKSANPDAHFLIVGDGPERNRLGELARELSLSNCTHFVGTRADVPSWLAALDVFTLTSHIEASPVSILEALACEVPVVATRVGSIPETVSPGETGFLASPGDAVELSVRWQQLISDRHLSRRMGETGRARVKTSGSLEAMVDGYEQLIQQIYGSKCTAASCSPSPDAEKLLRI